MEFVKYFTITLLFIFGINAKENDVDYEVYVNQIVNKTEKIVKKTLGLTCIGAGGRMPRDVEKISVKFMSRTSATKDEVRKIEVAIAEEFLKEINSHEKIRPFLREFPFKSDRVQISISFVDKNGKYFQNSIAYASLINNKITYYISDEEDDLAEIAEEPYEEAFKKCHNSMQN